MIIGKLIDLVVIDVMSERSCSNLTLDVLLYIMQSCASLNFTLFTVSQRAILTIFKLKSLYCIQVTRYRCRELNEPPYMLRYYIHNLLRMQ